MNFDELFEQMEQDELADAVTLTPREYAKLRKMYPQRVYRAIRQRKLKTSRCGCGRKIINVHEADEVLGVRKGTEEAVSEEEETSRSDLDTRATDG